MNRKLTYALGAVLILGFAGFSLAAFRTNLTPYVTFAEARQQAASGGSGRIVQVAGGLVPASADYDTANAALRFELVDTASGEKLPVRYHGIRPANLDEAISIVAIGRYDPRAQEFEATKLLVKCPSKYQGAEVTKSY